MKKILSITVLLGLSLANGFSQTPRTEGPTGIAGSVPEVVAYLSLTTVQLNSLSSIMSNYEKASEAILKQLSDKRMEMANAFRNNADAATIGKLTQEFLALQTQLTALGSSFTSQTTAVLSPAQRTKLKVLEDAAKLQVQVQQATQILLIVQ
jgi:hypothetical protein